MKKFLLPASLLLFAACTKEVTNVNVVSEPYRPAFRVSGVNNIVFDLSPFYRSNTMTMPVTVVYNHGEPQRVNLSLSDMPPGIHDTMTVSSGYPDFSTFVQFFYENAAKGRYPMVLRAAADTGKTQEYKFEIEVKGDTSCSGYLTSAPYQVSNTCSVTNNAYYVTFDKRGAGGDSIYLNNFRNNQESLMLLTNCQSSQINIPYQSSNGKTRWGNGYFSSNYGGPVSISMYLYERDDSTQFTTSCSYYLNRM